MYRSVGNVVIIPVPAPAPVVSAVKAAPLTEYQRASTPPVLQVAMMWTRSLAFHVTDPLIDFTPAALSVISTTSVFAAVLRSCRRLLPPVVSRITCRVLSPPAQVGLKSTTRVPSALSSGSSYPVLVAAVACARATLRYWLPLVVRPRPFVASA